MTQTTSPKLKTSAMIASFADPGQKTTSAPFGHALVRAAEQDDRIVGLSADLAKYTDMHILAQAMPDRFFQIGMAEQLLLGAAAGMAEAGLIPFASTYSVFATRRAYDFLCLDAAEPGLNVNIVGGLPGLTTGYGPSHQATEDVAIFRGIPGLTIVDPCDSVDIEQAVPQLAAASGTDLPAAVAGEGAHGVGRVRLHLRARQSQGAAARTRCRLRLQRSDDHAGPTGCRTAGRPSRRRRRGAQPYAQAVRRRDRPRRDQYRPARDHLGEPHRDRRVCSKPWPRPSCGRDSDARWSRWPCPTRSWTPAPSRPCTIGMGSPPIASSTGFWACSRRHFA